MITRTLTTLDIFDDIVNTNFEAKTSVFVIGFSDRTTAILDEKDLVLYLGTEHNAHKWCKYVVYALRKWLMTKRISAHEIDDKLMVSDIVLAEYEEELEPTYSKNIVIVRVPNGLNQYGITGDEVYEVLNTVVNHYNSAVINKEGDS